MSDESGARKDAFGFIPGVRGRGEPRSERQRTALDLFLLWLWDVTVEREPEVEEVRAEAEQRGVHASMVRYQREGARETEVAYELSVRKESSKANASTQSALVVLLKLGTDRAVWPVLYQPIRPPHGANRHPHQ
jgi:hypothetical protein